MVTSGAVDTAISSKAVFWGSFNNGFTNRKDIAERIATDNNNQIAYRTFVIYAGITNVGYFTGVLSFTSNKDNYFAIVARRGTAGVIEHWNCDGGTFTLTTK